MKGYPSNGTKRATDGCIITFENAAGERLTLQSPGAPQGQIGSLCDEALSHDETYRVIAYSTPESIYLDITGARGDFVGRTGYTQRRGLPEQVILARAQRPEMLHKRLALVSDERKVRLARAARIKKATAA